MFARQWFGPKSQVALEQSALDFESLLRGKKFFNAKNIANNQLISATETNSKEFWERQYSRACRLEQRCKNTYNIGVAFRGFWAGFNQKDNEILNLLLSSASLIGYQIHLDSTDPDLVIYSCFGNPNLNEFPKSTRLLYLGENVRPDFGFTDYSLTFDMSRYCGRNIYLPLWLLRSTKYAAISRDYKAYLPAELEVARSRNSGINAIAYIGNNSTPQRVEAILALRQLGMKVECYGSQTKPVTDKIQTLKNYKYTLCFENSYTPGYVTEKLIDSFLAGSIPIYWGGAPSEIFNLEKYYVCDPYKTICYNMENFTKWGHDREEHYLPPLLKIGAYKLAESGPISALAKIFWDLF